MAFILIQFYHHKGGFFIIILFLNRESSQSYESRVIAIQNHASPDSQYHTMSIYSGFATRGQEETYDQCIDSLLFILQRRILKFYKNEEADEEKFIALVLKIHHQLKVMEQNKYLEPKSSTTFNQLVKTMQVHQKNGKTQKYVGNGGGENMNYEPLPSVEQNSGKKKPTLWVERAVAKRDLMVDQEIQTMGAIVEKKESPRQSSVSRTTTNHRNVLSSFKTKYAEKTSKPKNHHQGELPPPTQGHGFKNRSQSHHLANNETFYYDYEVRNHLKDMEVSNKKKRRAKISQRLGLRDLPTQQQSQYEVGDIIKDYVTRIRRKGESRGENDKLGRVKDSKLSDF